MLIEQREIGKVIPYANNPRVNDQAIAKVAASIAEFGFRQPIVVDGQGVVIVGHTRLEAARTLGMKLVPVHVAEGLSTTKAKAYRLADNRLNQDSTWDLELLPIELEQLADVGFDLNEIGFSEDELSALLEPPQTSNDYTVRQSDHAHQTMTFVFDKEQATLIREALDKAIEHEDLPTDKNKNGTALWEIARQWLALKTWN